MPSQNIINQAVNQNQQQPEQQPERQNETVPTVSFAQEKVLNATRTERRLFSRFVQNKKFGLFVNIRSRTPEDQPTVITSYEKPYIIIEFNEELRVFLNFIYDNFSEEQRERLSINYRFDDFVASCERKGFIKCECDGEQSITPGFFSQVVRGNNGRRTGRPFRNPDFENNTITRAVYSLGFTGCWRNQRLQNGEYKTYASAIKVKVYKIYVESFISLQELNADNEERRQEELRIDALNILNDDEEEEELPAAE